MKMLAFAALAATSAFATTAFAQTSDTTPINASVASICRVDAPEGGTVTSTGRTFIGQSTVQCNDPDGFFVVISSANAGDLRGSRPNNTSSINYLLDIEGAGRYDLTTPQTLPGTANQRSVDGFSLPTFIDATSFNGPAFADTYSDTITYTITQN